MNHTPGPWNWYVRSDGQVYLATPNRGHLIVMDFVRKGMNAAQPRFAVWDGDERANMGGIMVAADKMNVSEHPDALLLKAAPDLLAACEQALEDYQGCESPTYLIEAIAKAKGQTP